MATENMSTQSMEEEARFYSGTGSNLTKSEFLDSLSNFAKSCAEKKEKGVLLVGENHEDGIGHQIESDILTLTTSGLKLARKSMVE